MHQARAEARAEAEAAVEQRLAALDQARRDEREAAVRAALALGVRRVRARLYATPLWHAFSCAHSRHTVHQTCHQAATERARRGSWHGLLARRRVPQAAVRGTARHGHACFMGVYPVTAEILHHARARPPHVSAF